MADTNIFATSAQLSNKQDTISDLSTIRAGANLGASAIQPATLEALKEDYQNKLAAISGAEEITYKWYDGELDAYEKFIYEYHLDEPTVIYDIGSLIEPESTRYYTSIVTAITDINNKAYTNATTDATNAECQIFKNDDMVILKILKNIDLSEYLNVQNACMLDLNGHSINFCGTKGIGSVFRKGLYIYGQRDGSRAYSTVKNMTSLFIGMSNNMYILGGTYELTAEGTAAECGGGAPIALYAYGIIRYRVLIAYAEINYSYISTDGISGNSNYSGYGIDLITGMGVREKYIKIAHCKITANNNAIYTLAVGANCGTGTIYVDDCEIIRGNANYPSSTDDVDKACAFEGAYSIITNSHIKGPNYAMPTKSNTYISNCIMEGSIHGGIYADSIRKEIYESVGLTKPVETYVKDSVLKLSENNTGHTANPYSCYIGYGAIVSFDNCRFESYNNLYNRPAIKTGNNGTNIYKDTRAYFSNCTMDSIRVDADCTAFMGLGMADSLKQQSVGGKIIDTGRSTYSYRLVEAPKHKLVVTDGDATIETEV